VSLKELEKRLKKEPDNLGLRVQVAGLMRESGRSTEAVELYRSVALAYRDQGRTQQAIAVCKAILEIAPDDDRCIALLSMLNGRSTPSIPSIAPPPAARTPTNPPPAPRAAPTNPPHAPNLPLRPSQPPQAGRPPFAQPARTGSQPPKTSSRPPPVVVIPPKRAVSEIAGTPPPAPARAPTEPAPPSPVTARLPLEPPARKSPSIPPGNEPKRRSSLEETPLPRPVPHHVYDPTGKNASIDPEELDTNPSPEPKRTKSNTGLAEAARKIAGKMVDDVSRPLDTRPVRRIKSDELRKIDHPPPTVELERIEDDTATQPGDDEMTTPRDRLDPEDV
jgi:hypothetical protein